METFGSATLTEEIPAHRAVAATVSREGIIAAMDDETGRPELLLQIARPGEDGQEERSTIGIAWSRADLEQLLERATDDNVTLTFDREELSLAVADVVEAHGLRGRALVFAVAAAGALGSGATIANAMPTTDGGPISRSPAPAAPAVQPGPSGGLVDIHAPSPIDGLIVGGIGLAVVGATFASRRARTTRLDHGGPVHEG